MEISLGFGDIEICPVERDGKCGVLLKKHKEEHYIGEPTNLDDSLEDFDVDTDVIIWFNHMGSARVFQDGVNLALLNMQGFKGGKFEAV